MNLKRLDFIRLLVSALFIHLMAARASAQQSFATPDAAADALFAAASGDDPAAMTTLLGSDFVQHVSSGDLQADRIGVKRLNTLMLQGYKLSSRGGRTMLVEIGADKWPFPLPLVKIGDGAWVFDVEFGKQEFLRRRIEKNEMRAGKIAEFYAAAQKQYFAMSARSDGVGSYAQKFLSSPGQKDGLYWEIGADGVASPLEKLVARSQNLGYEKQGREEPLLMGYHYRVLIAQGESAPGKTQSYFDASGKMTKGFALIAYPSRYGISGRTSFLVGQQGIVYARDLGEKTELLASRIKEFDPDASWRPFSGLPTQGRAVKVVTTNEWSYPF